MTAPRRRWSFRFSLRTMLLLTAAAAVPTFLNFRARKDCFLHFHNGEQVVLSSPALGWPMNFAHRDFDGHWIVSAEELIADSVVAALIMVAACLAIRWIEDGRYARGQRAMLAALAHQGLKRSQDSPETQTDLP